METTIVKLSDGIKNVNSVGLQFQILMRTTPLNEWLNNPILADRLSGTLRKNARIGFKYYSQLESEAICQTLGWGFEVTPTTYVTFNDAITEGDCHAITEVGWHVDRLLMTKPFDEDKFTLKYIIIQDACSNIVKQGVGVVLKETSIQWIRKGYLCYSILTEYDVKTGNWSECINPF